MTTIADRLNYICKHLGIKSYAEFGRRTNLNHQTASNYLKGLQKPDIDNLSKIVKTFNLFNAYWIITGEGEIINNENKPEVSIDSHIRNIIRSEIEGITEKIEMLKLLDKVNTETIQTMLKNKQPK